jgi:hypothetical protein
MNLTQLRNRVQHEADARLSDVVERLLFILEHPPFLSEDKHLVWKWEKTGLLADLDETGKIYLSQSLEIATNQLLDWCALESPTAGESEKRAVDTFVELRNLELIKMDERKRALKFAVRKCHCHELQSPISVKIV